MTQPPPEASKRKKQKNLLQKSRRPLKNYAKYTSLAMEMALIIVAGVFGGWKLDEKLGLSFPVFTLIFSILALFLALYVAVRDFLRMNK